MELVKAYGINIKHNDTLGFERLVTFNDYNIACGAYQTILCSQEAEYATIELEEITVLETVILNIEQSYKILHKLNKRRN